MLLMGLLIGGGLYVHYYLPPMYKPWAPLNLENPVGPFTEIKIAKLANDPQMCHSVLDQADIEYSVLPDKAAGSCELENRIELDRSLYPYSASVAAKCSLVTAITLWEREVVQKAAELHLDSPVAKINHFGIFSCRNVQGSRRISQHASENAIDIAGFVLKNGQTISVLRDWPKDSPESDFLKYVHENSCSIFKGVLGPEYNNLHRDHFHLDLGPYNICV